jgi:putative membrane protein
MTIRTLPIAALTVAFLSSTGLAREHKPLPAGDAAAMMVVDRTTFATIVSSANEFEIISSELALKQAESEDVKDAAKMIIADHQKARIKLKAILEAKDAPLASPTVLAPKHQRMADQLQVASGKQFDMLYLDMQAQAHMEAIGLFRTYAGAGDDQSIVGFAKETLPVLETHLAHVKVLVAAE